MPAAASAKVILFDLFGVFTEHRWVAEQEALLGAAGARAAADPDAFWRAYWDRRPDYDRAAVTAAQYWRQVGDDLGVEFPDPRISELISADCGSWRTMAPPMVYLLEALAARGQTVALLSNIPEELAADFVARFEWFQLFSVLGFSCRIGAAKPDPAAFRWCLAELGVDPADVLFVDDRQENVTAAEDLGIRGKLFVGADELGAFLGV